MVEIQNREELEEWLNGREREDAITIAARAALRVLPISARIFTTGFEGPRENFVFHVFRATANSRAAAVGSAREFGLTTTFATTLASEAATNAYTSARTTAYATAACAATAAARSTEVAIATTTHAALHASDAADAAARTTDATAARTITAVYAATDATATVWASVSADATALKDGIPAATLAAAPLWPNDAPEWVTEDWAILVNALNNAPDEDWGVWIDWYEARLRGDPPNEALERARVLEITEEMWKQGPKVVNAEIRRLIDLHTKPPSTPSQEPAPVMAEIRNGEISRRDPDAPAQQADMATIHGLLLTDAQWLSSNLSQQHGAICDMVGNAVTALGNSLTETDSLTLGYHSKPIASRAKTANETLLEDQAARLQGFSANLDLFVVRLEGWNAYLSKAPENPISSEEVKAVEEETKSLLDGIREWSKDLYDERIPAMLDELYLSLSESSVYSVETPYGFYLSLRNVLTITMQAAINAIPTDLIREESDEIVKSLRKKARKFVHERAGELTVLTGLGLFEGLKAALRFIVGG